MLSNQEMIQLLASATSDDNDSYKSMQELIRIIASCVGVDEETGDVFLKVKEVEDNVQANTVSQGLGFGLGSPQSTLVEQEDNGGDNDSLQD